MVLRRFYYVLALVCIVFIVCRLTGLLDAQSVSARCADLETLANPSYHDICHQLSWFKK